MKFDTNKSLSSGTVTKSAEKRLEDKIEKLESDVSDIGDKVTALESSVTTTQATIGSGYINTLSSDEATMNTAEITELAATDATINTADITTAEVETITADELAATRAVIANAYTTSINSNSYTGSSVNVLEVDTTELNAGEVTAETVEAEDVTVNGSTELKGLTTHRGDVYFPDQGQKMYGQYLKVEAQTVKASSLNEEVPGDSTRLVGYDNTGKLIPIDASLNPSNLWKKVDESETLIEPKENRIPVVQDIQITKLIDDEPTSNAVTVTINEDGSLSRNELADVAVSGSYNDLDNRLYAGDNITITGDNKISAENTIYTAGDNVTISDDNVISSANTTYSAGNNISISDDHTISCDISTMNYRGSVATYDDLPSTGQIVGDVWNVENTATNYCWNGTAWTAIGSSVDVSGLMNKDGSNANIPTNTGTLTESNELLVKDSDGKIKGESIADIKDDFFPVAKALNNNLTSADPIKARTMYYSLLVKNDTSSSEGTNIINVVAGEALYVGMKVRVLLQKKLYATSSTTKVQVKALIAIDTPGVVTKDLKVYKCGTKINLPSHLIDGQYVFANEGTYFDMVYDGTDFIVLGNPEVITYTSDTVSYRIKADGFIEIDMRPTETADIKPLYLPVSFSNNKYICLGAELNTTSDIRGVMFTQLTTSSVYVHGRSGANTNIAFEKSLIFKGY